MKTKIKTFLLVILMAVLFGGCARQLQGCNKNYQTSERDYHIKVFTYQGVQEYHFHGILNNQEHSDGYYWFNGDTLVEVGGTVEVKSWK